MSPCGENHGKHNFLLNKFLYTELSHKFTLLNLKWNDFTNLFQANIQFLYRITKKKLKTNIQTHLNLSPFTNEKNV